MQAVDLKGSSLVLMVTLGCNLECAHCCLACNRSKINQHISEQEMCNYILDANQANIDSVVFTGGEPTLYLSDIYKPMKLAQSLGMYIDLRTNGQLLNGNLKKLKEHGLCRLGLSFDSFHNVKKDIVLNAIKTAQDLGIEVYLDWVGSEPREFVKYYLDIDDTVLRMVGEPMRVGQAVILDSNHFCDIPIDYVENCSEYSHSCGKTEEPLLTVFPDHYVSLHACCWVHPKLIFKQARGRKWIEQLTLDSTFDLASDFLYRKGIGGLIKKARKECPDKLKDTYSHQCEACYDLLGTLFPVKELVK